MTALDSDSCPWCQNSFSDKPEDNICPWCHKPIVLDVYDAIDAFVRDFKAEGNSNGRYLISVSHNVLSAMALASCEKRSSNDLDRAIEATAERARKHARYWLDRDDNFWIQRLLEEVTEAGGVIHGTHNDELEHELVQVASIAINMLAKKMADSHTKKQ